MCFSNRAGIIHQLNPVQYWHFRATLKMDLTTDIGCHDDIWVRPLQRPQSISQQFPGNIGLQHRIRACRPTAKVTVCDLDKREACPLQGTLDLAAYLLAML